MTSRILPAIAFMLLGVAPAHAELITFTSSLTPEHNTGGTPSLVDSQILTLPRFDETLGTLTSVMIALTVDDIDVLGGIINETLSPNPASTVTFGQQYSLSVSGTSLLSGLSLTTTNFGSDLALHRFSSRLPSFTDTFSTSTGFAPFSGTGTFDLLFNQFFVGGLDDVSLTQLRIFESEFNLRSGNVAVTYTYDTATVPEPSTLVMVGLGAVLLQVRKRKT
jgi:hypothetical protein